MNKEKQIEKMAKIPESEMGISGYSKFSWKLWEEGLCNMAEAQEADQIMREMGYRLASDVAREIFEEIEREIKNHGICYTQRKIAELKKKYTEGGE